MTTALQPLPNLYVGIRRNPSGVWYVSDYWQAADPEFNPTARYWASVWLHRYEAPTSHYPACDGYAHAVMALHVSTSERDKCTEDAIYSVVQCTNWPCPSDTIRVVDLTPWGA